MDAAWVVAATGILSIVGTAAVGMRNAGARDERLRAHGYRIRDLEVAATDTQKKLGEHGERIAKVEARCAAVVHQGGD